ncbi:MAG: Enterobactin synthase component D [Candidatus Erwinia impunctatus]|nr:Enterobactin synthase component D [Culicoides impunctatus]
MFCMSKEKTTSPFIRSMEVGYVKCRRIVRVCIVEFDVEHFKDTLFSDYTIPFTEGLSTAVIKRRAEHLAGRIAAQRLLKEEGMLCPVGVQSDRSPQWPLGWTGSISHTDRYAISVIAPKNECAFLGVDMEKFNPGVMKNTADVFLSSPEKEYLKNTGIEFHIALLIAFSAKESLFKALYPLTGNFFGFDAARMSTLKEKSQNFTMELLVSLSSHFPVGDQYTGHYKIYHDYIITLLSADETQRGVA